MGKEVAGQRRFAVMGENMFKIAVKILNNQNICRLLKYQVRDPFDTVKYEDVNGMDLLHKQILIVPKIYDDSVEKMSYITVLFNDFIVNQINPEFKVSTIRFDIACPYDEWVISGWKEMPQYDSSNDDKKTPEQIEREKEKIEQEQKKIETWNRVNGRSLRPFLIMQELDKMFNEAQINGIGTLQFVRASALTLSPQIGGYSMWYQIHEFN